jgi:hypothetical protein
MVATHMKKNKEQPPSYYHYEMIGCGLGAALGWLLAPSNNRQLGLGIGTIVGGLLAIVWKWYRLRRQCQTNGVSRTTRSRQIIYLVGLGGCLYMLWLVLSTWALNDQKGLEVVAGLLFFGVGGMVLFLLWKEDQSSRSDEQAEARRTILMGVCSLGLAISGLILIALGNLVLGVAATVFYVWGGVVLIRKGRSLQKGFDKGKEN